MSCPIWEFTFTLRGARNAHKNWSQAVCDSSKWKSFSRLHILYRKKTIQLKMSSQSIHRNNLP